MLRLFGAISRLTGRRAFLHYDDRLEAFHIGKVQPLLPD